MRLIDNLAEGEVRLLGLVRLTSWSLCLGIVGEDCTTVHVVAEGLLLMWLQGLICRLLLRIILRECTNIYPGEV